MTERKRKAASKKLKRSSIFDAVDRLEKEDEGEMLFGAAKQKRRRQNEKLKQQRSKAAASQMQIYRRLLECRILLQRAIQQQGEASDNMDEEDTAADTVTSVDQCNQLLINLLKARKQLQIQSIRKEGKDEDDYRGIFVPSDDDDSGSEQDSQQERGASAGSLLLQSEYKLHSEEWKEVLNRRHQNLRLQAGSLTAKNASQQFSTVQSSFWEQVQATVQHYQQQRHQKIKNHAADEQQHNFRFDDTKVYQQHLKEFVSISSAADQSSGTTDNINSFAAADSRIGKKKKTSGSTVDRRASKGRKIRYTEIPKLVNFTFPMSKQQQSINKNSNGNTGHVLEDDEWFRSLFGGAAYQNHTKQKKTKKKWLYLERINFI